ncbi:MAG: ribulose-phosphate 3-epimerase, partial [Dehalococcoidia bacterium]|nr:ribulose-phosphate 3-epimerase [Dehalococcoidia bacterium]
VVQTIKEKGAKVGISLNPSTPPVAIWEVLPLLDLVLVMSVNPGFGGQSFIPGTLSKLQRVRAMLDGAKSLAELEVDGGVNAQTAASVVKAGADVLVAGSAIFNKRESVAQAIARLRDSLPGGPQGRVGAR